MTRHTDGAEETPHARVLGALGALLGVAFVVVIVALATRESAVLFVGVVSAFALACLRLLGSPRWRPGVVGVLVGMAGTYVGGFALFVLWIAGVGPT